MNTDQLLLVRARHDGEMPASWAGGDENFQRAKVLAAIAWANTKPELDPLLQHCDLTHQETCTAIAQSIIAGNKPDNTPFALKVAEIWNTIKLQTQQQEITP